MKTKISEMASKKSVQKKWNKTFQIGNKSLVFGWQKDQQQNALFFEIISVNGDLINIRRHLFQQIMIGEKMRFAYHKQHKTLKKV